MGKDETFFQTGSLREQPGLSLKRAKRATLNAGLSSKVPLPAEREAPGGEMPPTP